MPLRCYRGFEVSICFPGQTNFTGDRESGGLENFRWHGSGSEGFPSENSGPVWTIRGWRNDLANVDRRKNSVEMSRYNICCLFYVYPRAVSS